MFTQTVAKKNTVLDPSLKTAAPEPLLPRGSALITTSGLLTKQGIGAIINAATGSMSLSGGIFDPTPQSTIHSIQNSFDLLNANGYGKVAVPYICGGIFKSRMGITDEDLAKLITDACFESNPDANEFVLVMIDHQIYKIFQKILADNYPKIDASAVLKQGSITDFSVHKCDTIMNASNMEVVFGGGLAGAIGRATGEATKIDAQALVDIKAFWKTQDY